MRLDAIIFWCYEFLTSFIPFLIILMVFRAFRKKKGVDLSKKYYVAIIIFALYIIATYHVTGIGTLYDAFNYHLEIRKEQLNFIPFSNDIYIIPYLLNIVLFVPFGGLGSFLVKERNSLVKTTGVGFLFSLLIEISQLLNNRSTDIDDLILNTIGAMIGAFIFQLFFKSCKKENKSQSFSKVELLTYTLVMFLGRFFLYNELGLVRLLYI